MAGSRGNSTPASIRRAGDRAISPRCLPRTLWSFGAGRSTPRPPPVRWPAMSSRGTFAHWPAGQLIGVKIPSRGEPLRHSWVIMSSGCPPGWRVGKPLPLRRTRPSAATAVTYLQFFDALSLWLCCAPATARHSIEGPGGSWLSLTPLNAERIVVDPWPFGPQMVHVEVPGRQVAIDRYATADALAAAPSQAVRLRWTLEPASAAD